MCHGGNKTNIIPDAVDVEVDIRTIPGDDEDEVRRHLDKALGDLADEVEIEKLFSKPASMSPTDTPLWDVLGKVVAGHYPGNDPRADPRVAPLEPPAPGRGCRDHARTGRRSSKRRVAHRRSAPDPSPVPVVGQPEGDRDDDGKADRREREQGSG